VPVFAYRVLEPDGRESTGWLEAESEESLIGLLHGQGKVILGLQKREARRAPATGEMALRLVEPRVRQAELVVLATQLSAMVDAGLPLLRSLQVLAQETENLRLRRILADVCLRVEAGSSLSQALAAHPVFGNLFVSLARAGEVSGKLGETLRQLANYLERVEDLRRRVRSALTYPAFLLSFSMMVLLVLVVWLIPAFSKVYDKFKAKIPGPTLLLMDLSQLLRGHMAEICAVAGLLGLGWWLFIRTEKGLYFKDWILLRIPVMGPLILRSTLARLCRTLGVLVGSGIPFWEALDLATQATDHRVARKALVQAALAIEGGSPISGAFQETGFFPRMLLSMLASGEEVGGLHAMLMKAADFYDQQLESSVKGFMSLLEPVMILFLGGVIGGILFAMYLPVFTLGKAIR
jgi:type IV pilus assembly protein PilC